MKLGYFLPLMALGLTACDDVVVFPLPLPEDGGSLHPNDDAGVAPPDAGVPDAGAFDGGRRGDASAPDAGDFDGGRVNADASAPDAGVPDAGGVDAGGGAADGGA